MKTELITVPTFLYQQGKIGDVNFESPIHVDFYNGSIVLRQDGGYEQQETIQIRPEHLDGLFKAIKKHLPEAEVMLKK